MSASAPGNQVHAAGPRSVKGARTRARLVAAAKDVFERIGFLDARISDIADRAGVSYGSFYHYFTSKEEVFAEVARAQEDELDAQLDVQLDGPAFDGSLDGSSGVHPDLHERAAAELEDQLASSIRRYLREYRAEARIMGVIEQVSRFDPEVSQMRFERLERFAGTLVTAIAQAQRMGALDPALDPSIAAYVVTAMINRIAESWFVQGELVCTFDQGIDQVTRFCRNSLQLGGRPAWARD